VSRADRCTKKQRGLRPWQDGDMKLVTFGSDNALRLGVVVAEGVVDITARAPTLGGVRAVLAASRLSEVAELAAKYGPDHALADVTLAPVVPDPSKIFCVGVNYPDHRAETGRPVVAYPTIFTRIADTLTGHRTPLIRPRGCERFDYEGELAVVIGRTGRDIPPEHAFDYVAGYACFDEATARDYQAHTSQFTPGKNFPRTGGFGPWLVTRDEAGDEVSRKLETRVNGAVVQSDVTGSMIFGIPALLAYCSRFAELRPGDVIVTGTPGGVGAKRMPPLYLGPGDVVEVEIEGIGLLRNTVEDER
jgi:2-keto-4-pentenoate hydratase/2-oxohepta-3-ene-1,7-dioic acid hydratase in catechol pathway